ncbi:MAG: cell wall hydrolase [Pseudomonadales bacterium]
MARLASLLILCFLASCSNPPEPTTAQWNKEEQQCLALSMYWEAKAEGNAGMLAVGHVILNRVAHERFPSAPCAVVFQGGEKPPCQFSWYCDGKSDRPTEPHNWATARLLAAELLQGKHKDSTGSALFFHGKGMKNPWRIPRTRTVTIGNHVFYKL